MALPILPAVLAGVAAGAAYLGWRLFDSAPAGVTIQYPLASKIAYPLNATQMEAAEGVERALIDEKIPPEIGAAIFANYWSESKLLPDAIGDDGASVGVAQININARGGVLGGGVMPYLTSPGDRNDPYKSTVGMIAYMRDNQGTPTLAGASPGGNPALAGPDPLTLYEQGSRDIVKLTTAFRYHVERPAYSASGVASRERHAREMFPVRAII